MPVCHDKYRAFAQSTVSQLSDSNSYEDTIPMITKTVRSRFSHEIGEKVEGCTIIERRIVIPAQPSERRLGVYDYLVEVPPTVVKVREPGERTKSTTAANSAPSQGSFVRSTPEEMGGRVIRRVPAR